MAAFPQQLQSWIVVTETMWPTVSKISAIRPFTGKKENLLTSGIGRREGRNAGRGHKSRKMPRKTRLEQIMEKIDKRVLTSPSLESENSASWRRKEGKTERPQCSKGQYWACVRSGGKAMVLVSPGPNNRNKVAVILGSCVHVPEERGLHATLSYWHLKMPQEMCWTRSKWFYCIPVGGPLNKRN